MHYHARYTQPKLVMIVMCLPIVHKCLVISSPYWSSHGVVVNLLACGARSLELDSRSHHFVSKLGQMSGELMS